MGKKSVFIRVCLSLALSTVIIVSFGQGCSSNFGIESTTSVPKVISSNTNEVSGNGGTYDGKLVFLHLVPGFTCEGKLAPKSILSRNESKQWYLTVNQPDKCASLAQQPVQDVAYKSGFTTLEYLGLSYNVDLRTPDVTSGLPDYPVQFLVSAKVSPDNPDVLPGDDICSDAFGKCSLRAAFDEVNSKANRPAIVVLEAGTYKISQSLKILSNSVVVIKGLDSTNTAIDGQGAVNILRTSGDGVGPQKYLGTAIIEKLSFIGGRSAANFTGAAITNYSSLTIRDCIFMNNLSSLGSTVYSGGHSSDGDIVVERSRFSNNGNHHIFEVAGSHSTTVKQSTFASNPGMAALAITSGTRNVLIQQSSFYNNVIGIFLSDCADNCRLENNTIADNSNFGLQIHAASSFASNHDLFNNTIYHNALSSTLFANIGFDVGGSATSSLTINNNIIASGGSGRSNCKFAGIASLSTITNSSVIDDASCAPQGTGNIFADPLLTSISDNGGSTWTLLPTSGSPVIDAGGNANCASIDQRGFLRPVDFLGGGAICDIGAVELY